MPLYQYKCPKCGWLREDMRKVEERADGPVCDRHPDTKMHLNITAAAVVIKDPAVPRRS